MSTLTTAETDLSSWQSTTHYRSGDRVVYAGFVWEAQWKTTGENPVENRYRGLPGRGRQGPWKQLRAVKIDRETAATPSAPTDLTATTVDMATVTLTWTASTDDEIQSYRIYRDTAGQFTPDESNFVHETDTQSYTDSGLAAGTQYVYKVTAVNTEGVEGPPSAEHSVMTTEPVETVNETRIAAYYTRWSREKNYSPSDVPFDNLTHLNYAFLDVEPDGEVTYADPTVDRRNLEALRDLKSAHPETTLLLSVGGWTLSKHFSDAAATQDNRERFARTAIELVRRYDFDGVDIDWEYPTGGGNPENTSRPEDPRNYVLLLDELRAQLDTAAREDGRPYELTVTISGAKRHVDGLDTAAINRYVDTVNVMTYDYTGGWSPHTGFNAPLYGLSEGYGSVNDSMQYWAASEIDEKKLVLGLAFYSRRFTSVSDENNGLQQAFSDEGAWHGYQYIESELLSKSSYEYHWHETANVPWVYSPEEGVFVTYDNPKSIGRKAAYAAEHEFGGVMCWELSQNRNGELLATVNEELNSS